ncbi:hypothetical protein O3P69_004075 [Scylla paramamosain]|uniref:Nephrin n=1 Tax=Scylla paramamosain TaxID=85552 RepID=A0AAW0UGU8_SCYPA
MTGARCSPRCGQVWSFVLTLLLVSRPATTKVLQPKKGLESSPLTEVKVLEGGKVILPCDVSPSIADDDTILVLFYRGSFKTPIYSIDGRSGPVRRGQHWSDEKALGRRAYLELAGRTPGLVIEAVRAMDQDLYRCRVDYDIHPTRNVRVQLNVIVPPKRVRVVGEAGVEVSGVIGPYPVGSSLTLHCRVENGRPPPMVTWWSTTTLLDNVSEEQRGDFTVNTLTLPQLTRADLKRVLTCQAANSNLSAPSAVTLTIDMTFPPVVVKILAPQGELVEGRHYKVVCEASGSRPKAEITWWKDGMLMTDATTQEGNVSRSTLQLKASLADHDKTVLCRAKNPLLPAQVIEDGLKLDVRYKPRLSLAAGLNLDMNDIKEGDDVYFECGIKANPRVYKVLWYHDGKELSHNVSAGIIKSNQSLVLQRVSRRSSGFYTCSAANLQGSGDSRPVELSVKFAPTCQAGQKVVYGAGKHEQLNVTCSVEAHPPPDSFRWAFNSSSEVEELASGDVHRVDSETSQVTYTPRSHLHYGSLLCWATNIVARQIQPCIFHIIHASPPDPVNNCTVKNISSTGVGVRCQAGWDGGLAQTFTLSVSQARGHTRGQDTKKAPRVLANTSTSPRPEFSLTGLEPGTEYVLTIHGTNKKGQSEPVRLAIFTLKDVAEKRTSPGVGVVGLAPIVGVAAGVAMSVLVTCVVMVVVVKVRQRSVPRPEVKMVYMKGADGPSQGRGQEEASEGGDDPNPDLIPVNHDHQVKDTAQVFKGEASPEGASSHDQREDFSRDMAHPDLQSDLQREDPPAGQSYGSFYTPPLSLLRQRSSLLSRDGDPLLQLGHGLVSSSPPPPAPRSSTYTLSHDLPPYPHMSSTPSSPTYPNELASLHISFPADTSYSHPSASISRTQPLLPVSYRNQFSTLPSRSYAHHRFSLGQNEILGRVTPALSSVRRRGSTSMVAGSPEREMTLAQLIDPKTGLDFGSSQRESSV